MSNIIYPKVEEYLDGFYKPVSGFLGELRQSAESRGVPIIRKDTEIYLQSIFALRRPVRILEIGTAVGYSACFFATLLPQATITTLELSETSVAEAVSNIHKAGFSDRIKVIQGDAMETLATLNASQLQSLRGLTETFDFVFLDGPKGHYQAQFDIIRSYLENNAMIISDNILHKGMVADEGIVERRQRTITRRMQEYLKYINEDKEFQTSILSIGDGIAMSVYKKLLSE